MATSSRKRSLKEKDCNSFYKVPSKLVESYGGVMPSKVALTTDESEKRWKLSVEEVNGQYFFTNGWKEFEQEMGSNADKLTMYKPVDLSKLNACFNELEIGDKNRGKGMKRSGKAHGTTRSRLKEFKAKRSGAETSLRFCIEVKGYHRYGLNFPMEFSMVIGTNRQIELKDREGRMWPVQVVKGAKSNFPRITTGWIDFLVGNKASIGSTIFFKTIPNCDNVIKVRVIDFGKKQKELFAKKPRGRPFSCSKRSMSP